MTLANELIQSFKTTHWLIGKFAEDMTNEESLMLPSFRANSFNWVLGHIVVSRDRVLDLLGAAAVLGDDVRAVYETGSEPVTQVETAVSLEQLLAALDDTQVRIIEALHSAGRTQLETIYNEAARQTVADRIAGLHWHETYHTGQLEILRQVSRERDPFP